MWRIKIVAVYQFFVIWAMNPFCCVIKTSWQQHFQLRLSLGVLAKCHVRSVLKPCYMKYWVHFWKQFFVFDSPKGSVRGTRDSLHFFHMSCLYYTILKFYITQAYFWRFHGRYFHDISCERRIYCDNSTGILIAPY